ncbi:hypothetical protein BamMEX5DRAFT_0910 [Burkholderia ambifaria MEX-5]|uniref:Uncharacterized protein n=1 Tax=Burkholderia ambifaria MEX-5 TaxID=396597 RepID=B1SZE4_9BURK|nr:hypothetical protein BamMEX5DRAFT_0910 [Burkholderia ambifaria MEX-5]
MNRLSSLVNNFLNYLVVTAGLNFLRRQGSLPPNPTSTASLPPAPRFR